MWVILPFVFGASMVGAIWSGLQHNRRRLRIWRTAVEKSGFHVVEISKPRAFWLKLKAQKGPQEVRIELQREGIRVTVTIPGRLSWTGVRLRRELQATWVAPEIEVGDELFDSTFHVEGPMRLMCALLDTEMRRLLIEVRNEGLMEISRSEIQANVYDDNLEFLLPRLLEVSERFAQSLDVPQRLAENARLDPEARVRLQNLILLVRELPGDARTAEVLRLACADPSPEIRLRAARELGTEGHGVLLELAEGTVDDVWSAQAVSALGRELPFERARAILIHALRRRRLQTARACLESLGNSAAAVETLAKVMAREKTELATAAALALGATGSEAAEAPLIKALQHAATEVRVAAATALGRLGSTAAVLPLKEAAERSPEDPEIGRATRQAIAEIQSRLQGASPGQLSLAGAEVGQLSLAQGEAGQLSLTADTGGQLSLSDERKP